MKKSLVVVMALLCLATLMAAMAYNNASTVNATVLNVVSTNEALLALIPKTVDSLGNKDVTATTVNGKLTFDFSKGFGGGNFGLQPDSEYKWDSIFDVKNNSNEKLSVQVNLSNVGTVNDPKFSFSVQDNSSNYQDVTIFTLLPNERKSVNVKLSVPSNVQLQQGVKGNIVVSSEAKN